MVLAAAIFLLGTRVSWAHDGAPDPRMLLNLDLFTQGQNSMLEQIRTLQAMGYLSGPSAPAPQPTYTSPPPPPEDSEDDVRE
jgi:hypothetical protein